MTRRVSLRAELGAAAADYWPLGLLSVVAVALTFGRGYFDRAPVYSFLLWNLQLAWVPVILGIAMRLLDRRMARVPLALVVPIGLTWLVFFPNAPYLVTDLVNLKWDNGAPRWYEVALLSAYGWAGLFLGFASLRDVHDIVARRVDRRAGWSFAVVVWALSAFGIYLGRELRWNSWDIVTEPIALLDDLVRHARHPAAHPRAWAMTAVFGALLCATYAAYRSSARSAQTPVVPSES